MSQEKKEKKLNMYFEKYFVVGAISLLVYKLAFEHNINLTYNKNSVIKKTHMWLKGTLDEDFQGGRSNKMKQGWKL